MDALFGSSAAAASNAHPGAVRRDGLRQLSALIPAVTRPAFERFGFPAAALLTDWSAIAGPELARFTAPERVKWPKIDEHDRGGADGEASSSRRGRSAARDARQSHVAGTLVLRVDGPLALELQHRSAQLIERINRYFGYRAIAALRILQAPLEDIRVQQPRAQRHGRGSSEAAGQARGARRGAPAPRPDLTSVGDPRLRDALEQLSRRVAPARDATPR